MDILSPRAQPRFAWPEATVLIVFTLYAFACVPFHEPWFDETQPWLIVRNSSLSDILLHRLHYEGAPALWSLVLWLMKQLHIPYTGMQYLAALMAVAGAYVWLRFNPLPRILSLLLPLTFFLQYQYTIISRAYVLFPLLAFSLMALYRDRRSKPLSFCLIAGLLANGSLHMAAFAAGLTILYVSDRLRKEDASRRQTLQCLAAPLVLLAVFFALAAATAWPTADGAFGDKVINTLRASTTNIKLTAVPVRAEDYPPPKVQNAVSAMLWRRIYPPADASPRAVTEGKLLKRFLRFLTLITAPISTSNLLAFGFLLLLVTVLWRSHLIVALSPYLLVIGVCITIQGSTHHFGMVWLALVCALWALAANQPQAAARSRLTRALYLTTLLVMVLQTGWSAYAFYVDVRSPYASSKATAEFIEQQPSSKKIAALTSDATSVNIYLPHTRFFNHQVDYWPFSRTRDPNLFADQTFAASPDIIVMQEFIVEEPPTNQWLVLADTGVVQYDDPVLTAEIIQHGYRVSHHFCGEHVFRNAIEMDSCSIIYERPTTTTPPS